jgi:hypothetical protein
MFSRKTVPIYSGDSIHVELFDTALSDCSITVIGNANVQSDERDSISGRYLQRVLFAISALTDTDTDCGYCRTL